MDLSTLRHELEKVTRGIDASDRAGYTDMLDRLQATRAAMNMLASHLMPLSRDDAAFLHDLIEELAEFVGDEPVCEGERMAALNAIARISQNLRDYSAG